MIDGKRVLAVIPARGGSKRLPRKNIKPLLGKPLLVWSIKQGLNSRYIDKLIVSSEDDEILKISEENGASIIKRPDDLAGDYTPTYLVILHLLDSLEEAGDRYDIIVLLEPTSPLRKKGDIDNALIQFSLGLSEKKCDALISVGEIHLENPYICKVIENGYVKPFIDSDIHIYRSQEYPKVYFPYGTVYISTVEAFKKNKSFYTDNTIPYFIERWQNYEIDDYYDFICVETILKEKISEVEG